VRYTIRFDPEFHKRLRIAVANRGLRSIQEAVVQSLERWLENDKLAPDSGDSRPAPKVARKDRQLVEALGQILQRGDKVAITAVESCIALAEERVKPRPKK
jgi:hypothetical protein